MKLSTYDPSNIEEIKQLFTETFSDSEGQSEGLLIGDLTYDLMTGTGERDRGGVLVTGGGQIVGSIVLFRVSV